MDNSNKKKRLKSLEEATSIQIVDNKVIDKAIKQKAKKSKTYKHNQKVLKELKMENKKEPIYIRALRKMAKLFIFIGKCIAYFIIGAIILAILLVLIL